MWVVGAVANLIVGVAYLGIVGAIAVPLIRGRQMRTNPLGAATALIFFTCAVHHGSHGVHMLLPYFGFDKATGLAQRSIFTWDVVTWDLVTAGVGVYYWTLRRTYSPLMHGAKLFEDLKERQRQALEINDTIVQGLFVAQTALALEEREMSEEALRTTLAAARKLISDLLGDSSDGELGKPGELIMRRPLQIKSGQIRQLKS